MNAAAPATLRHALRADFPLIIDIWADAFTGDPFLSWMAGDNWHGFAADWFGFILDLAFERGHTYIADGDQGAVAWIPPDLSLLRPGDLDRGVAIIGKHSGKERSQAALETIVAARSHLTEDPHWVLQYIGVRSSRRGGGLGTEMVGPQLDACRRDGLPCVLISSNPANIAFYRRQGFEVVAEVWTPDRSACLRPMMRPADA